MNKSIYICAAAAMMLASCSNDEVVEQAQEKGISFRSLTGLSTRALNATQKTLEDNGMYVTTFTENGTRLYPETHYVLQQSVWMADPAQTWGGYEKLSFYLTYPKLSEWDGDADAKIEGEDSEVFITVDEDIPDQKDYLAVYLPDVSKTKDAVPAKMQHVLSSVEIWAKNDNKAYTYKVKGIRICGIAKRRSFVLSEFLSGQASDNLHTIDFGARDYEYRYDTEVELGSQAKSLMDKAGNAILIPQPSNIAMRWDGKSTTDDPDTFVGTYLSVLVNLTAKAGASIYPAGSTKTNETYGWVSVPVDFQWKSGKKYVYTLDFSGGAGKVDPRDPGNDVDAGGKDPDKAEPILGGKIRFGVTVSEWGTDDKDVDLKDSEKFDVTVDGWTDDTKDAPLK